MYSCVIIIRGLRKYLQTAVCAGRESRNSLLQPRVFLNIEIKKLELSFLLISMFRFMVNTAINFPIRRILCRNNLINVYTPKCVTAVVFPFFKVNDLSTVTSSFLSSKMTDKEDKKSDLKKRLTPLQYHVTQEKGTERAYSGKFYKSSDAGTYCCVVCDVPLFASDTKYESHCGWPAFNDVLDQGKVKLTKDTSNVGANLLLLIANPGMIRTEVTCTNCGAHLGHVFNDGPPPKKKRFCINSAALNFHPVNETQDS